MCHLLGLLAPDRALVSRGPWLLYKNNTLVSLDAKIVTYIVLQVRKKVQIKVEFTQAGGVQQSDTSI